MMITARPCSIHLLAWLTCHGALWLSAGCAPDTSTSPGMLRAEGDRLRDGDGREVLLHGINARIDGLFDVTFDDGRVPLETIPTFSRDDLRFVRDELGMNALRVPINWSGLEPERGAWSDPYISSLARVLEDCAALEVWCLVDLHQDAYSKEIGEDGAPLWAIEPPPQQLLEGPLTDLEARRTSEQVLAAFDTFFLGLAGVQDAYLDMLARLTRELTGRPWVAGIEVFNEPVGDELTVLGFSERAAAAVHAVDPERLVLWEPSAMRNLRDEALTDGGLQIDNDAYAPHLYPEVFSGEGNNWENGDPTRLAESTARAREEADEHGAPLVVTEFGIDPRAPLGTKWIEVLLGELDRARASRFFWLYEEREQGEWGLFDDGKALRQDVADTLAIPFPIAIDGAVDAIERDPYGVSVRFTGGGSHVLSAPTRALGPAVRATCDGSSVDVRRDGARAHVRCGDGGAHVLRLERDGGTQ